MPGAGDTARVSSGTVTVSSDTTVATLTLDGGTIAGTATLTVTNQLNWTAGGMSGTGKTLVEAGAILFLANSGDVTLTDRTLENAGTVMWTGTADVLCDGGVISNRAGALWEARNDQMIRINGNGRGATPYFNNAGTFRKTTATGTTTFNLHVGQPVVFNNHGLVQLQSGALRLQGGGTNSGQFDVASGSRLEWGSTSYHLNSGAQLNGLGIYSNAAVLYVNAEVGVRKFDLAGTLRGTGTLVVSNEMNWTAGTMQETGRTIVEAGATLQLANSTDVLLTSRTLENAGTVLWTGTADVLCDGSVISNRVGALWEARNDQMLRINGNGSGATPYFNNAGTFRKTTATGTTTFNLHFGIPFVFKNYGLVHLQTGTLKLDSTYTQYAGETSLCSGNISNASALEITGGLLKGTGTISGSVNITGTATIESGCSPGRLTIGGNYSQGANATLHAELGGTGPGVSYDQLVVAGNASLAGALRVSLLPGFLPVPGNTFNILSSATRGGGFASFDYPSNRLTMTLSNVPSGVILRVQSVIPDGELELLPETLPAAVVSSPYQQTLVGRGSPGPHYFELIAGALPSGLSLSTNGLISGIPIAEGANTFTIRVSDDLMQTAEREFTVVVLDCPAIPDNILAWWRAESDASDTFSTNHGTLQNGATFAAGKVGQAFSFDGVDDYVAVPHSTALNPAGPFSVEVWIKANPTQPESLFQIIDKSHGFVDNTGWVIIGDSNGKPGLAFGNGSGFVGVNATTNVKDDQWHHLAGVYTGTRLEMYVDGVLQGAVAETSTPAANSRSVEMGRAWGGGTPRRHFFGLVDEAAFYHRALTSNEVAAIYAAGALGKCSETPYFITTVLPVARAGSPYSTVIQAALGTPPYTFTLTSGALADGLNLGADGVLQGNPSVAGSNALTIRVTDSLGHSAERGFMLNITPCLEIISGLVAYWPFNGDTMDVAGTNHGVLEGSAYFTNGMFGEGLFFGGTDQVRVKHSPELSFEPNQPMSVVCWVYRTSPVLMHILGKRVGCIGASEINYQLVLETPGRGIGFTIGNGTDLPVNTWAHLAASFDGTTMSIYTNGVLLVSGVTELGSPPNTADFLIGSSGTCERFQGIIDEVSIYNRALSAQEIQAAVTRPFLLEPPQITCPADIVANTDAGQSSKSNVTYAVTVTDNCPGVTAVCDPPSGSTFPKGVTTVTCTATDASDNTNTCSFTVTVRDLEPPQFSGASVHNLSADWSETTNPFGPWKLWKSRTEMFATNQPNEEGFGANAWAEAPFPKPGHVPAWWRHDLPAVPGSHAPCDILVHGAELDRTGSDFTSVRWTAPADGVAEIAGMVWTLDFLGRSQKFVLRKNGADLSEAILTSDGTYPLASPLGFERFSAGPAATRHTVVVGDELELAVISLSENGNLGAAMGLAMEIRVNSENSQPLPTNIVVTTDPGKCSKCNVTYPIMAMDNCPGVIVTCSPPSGSTFPKGVTSVTCTATDASGNTNNYSFAVTVHDLEPPLITCPTNITTICNVRNGAVVNFTVTATDVCDSNATIVCAPPSGSVFPFGTTTVNCTATDASGLAAGCSFTVTVREPFLRVALAGDEVVIAWDGNGTLQYAAELLGDGPPTVWLDVTGNPVSPYTVAPSETRRFYRVSGCHD